MGRRGGMGEEERKAEGWGWEMRRLDKGMFEDLRLLRG